MCLNPLPRTVKDSAEAGVWSSHCPVSGLDVVSEFRFLFLFAKLFTNTGSVTCVCGVLLLSILRYHEKAGVGWHPERVGIEDSIQGRFGPHLSPTLGLL